MSAVMHPINQLLKSTVPTCSGKNTQEISDLFNFLGANPSLGSISGDGKYWDKTQLI